MDEIIYYNYYDSAVDFSLFFFNIHILFYTKNTLFPSTYAMIIICFRRLI